MVPLWVFFSVPIKVFFRLVNLSTQVLSVIFTSDMFVSTRSLALDFCFGAGDLGFARKYTFILFE